MIVDMHTVQRIKDRRRTALIRDAKLLGTRQPVQVRRYATAEDPAVDRERQAKYPDRPAVTETHAWVDITAQEKLKVSELSGEDMRRLGYPNPREFRREYPNDREVVLVTFELVTKDEPKPRYLAPATGYTTSPQRAVDDLECVDSHTQREFSQEAHARDHRRNDERRERHEARLLEDRVRELRLAHERGDLDASRILAGIRRRVEAGENKRKAA